jgi:hypothetical protein
VVIPTALEGQREGQQRFQVFWGIALVVLAETFEGKDAKD